MCLMLTLVTRKEILIGPAHAKRTFEQELNTTANGSLTFSPIRKLYPNYAFEQLQQHRAVVVFPSK